jgi:complement component 1 Q subcomponent-binding protein
MSTAFLAARLLRRAATASLSSPLSALARRALHWGRAPVPLPRRLPTAVPSPAASARRFLASQSPASSSKADADKNLRRVIESEIECVVQSEESLADKVDFI